MAIFFKKSRHSREVLFCGQEHGFPALPTKIGSSRVSGLSNGMEMGCPHCFPHGGETVNASRLKRRNRNWKRYRRFQAKAKGRGTDIYRSA